MNKRNTFYLVLIFAVISSTLFVSSSVNVTANRGDRTGSPLSFGGCSDCHNNGAFSPTIELSLLKDGNPVSEYLPGEEYVLKYVMNANSPGFGFQATALLGNNSKAGQLSALSSNVTIRNLNNVSYAEHSSPSTSNTFEMTWVAPSAGSGTVTFYSGGVAANLASGSLGDNGTTASPLIILESEDIVNSMNELSSPKIQILGNPVSNQLNLSFTGESSTNIRIFSSAGKLVKSHSLVRSGYETIDVSELSSGIYFVHFESQNNRVVEKFIKL
jgi:hypothetical protein